MKTTIILLSLFYFCFSTAQNPVEGEIITDIPNYAVTVNWTWFEQGIQYPVGTILKVNGTVRFLHTGDVVSTVFTMKDFDSYNGCNFNDAEFVPNNVYTNDGTDQTVYFASSTDTHCIGGQKIAIAFRGGGTLTCKQSTDGFFAFMLCLIRCFFNDLFS